VGEGLLEELLQECEQLHRRLVAVQPVQQREQREILHVPLRLRLGAVEGLQQKAGQVRVGADLQLVVEQLAVQLAELYIKRYFPAVEQLQLLEVPEEVQRVDALENVLVDQFVQVEREAEVAEPRAPHVLLQEVLRDFGAEAVALAAAALLQEVLVVLNQVQLHVPRLALVEPRHRLRDLHVLDQVRVRLVELPREQRDQVLSLRVLHQQLEVARIYHVELLLHQRSFQDLLQSVNVVLHILLLLDVLHQVLDRTLVPLLVVRIK